MREAVIKSGRLNLFGARIVGDLDLNYIKFTAPMRLEECHLEGALFLEGSEATALALRNSAVKALNADDLNLLGVLNAEGLHVQGAVSLRNARIAGDLVLSNSSIKQGDTSLVLTRSEIDGNLYCTSSRFAGKIDLQQIVVKGQSHFSATKVRYSAEGSSPDLASSIVGARSIDELHETNVAATFNGADLKGGLFLTDDFKSYGEVSVLSARVGGQLDFSGAVLNGGGLRSVAVDRSEVDGGIYFVSTQCNGLVSLPGARIAGQLNILSSSFSGRTFSLNLDNADIGGDFLVRDGSTFVGGLSLASAHVGGITEFVHVSVESESSDAVMGLFASFDRGFAAQDRCTFAGGLNLHRSKIGGQFNLAVTRITPGPSGALMLDGATVDGSVYMQAVYASGEVRLIGATVVGQLNIRLCDFFHTAEIALYLDALQIKGDINFRRVRIWGSLSIAGAQVEGNVDLRQVLIESRGGESARFDNLEAESVRMEKVDTTGAVRLPSIKVRSQVALLGVSFFSPSSTALAMTYAQVTGAVICRPRQIVGTLDLRDATVGSWSDSKRTWPYKVALEGFTYDSIDAVPPVDVSERISWLDRNRPHFKPQTFRQYAQALANSGDSRGAKKVNMAMQHRYRTAGSRPVLRATVSRFLALTIGYGYAPFRLLLLFLLLVAFGFTFFSLPWVEASMVRASNVDNRIGFSALRYTLDLLVPGAVLGDRQRFTPTGFASTVATLYTLLGWSMAAFLLAGLTGLLKKD